MLVPFDCSCVSPVLSHFNLIQESQLKALKDTVHICFSSVLHGQTVNLHRLPATPTHLMRYSPLVNNSRVTFQQPHAKVQQPLHPERCMCEIQFRPGLRDWSVHAPPTNIQKYLLVIVVSKVEVFWAITSNKDKKYVCYYAQCNKKE